MRHFLHQHSVQHLGNMQQQTFFIGEISSFRIFEVILTPLLMEQISENGPKCKKNISQGSVRR